MQVTVRIHREDGALWADVVELPGVFAAGDTLDELEASLREGMSLYLERDAHLPPLGDVAAVGEVEVHVALAA